MGKIAFLLVAVSLDVLRTATVQFLDSRFTFTSNTAGMFVSFDCPADKWCGMIISGNLEPDVFENGDTYILARHSLCDCTCCSTLKYNDFPDHTCPHPTCCNSSGRPVGLRSFPSVMGEGWSWAKDRGIGGPEGLRGDGSCHPAEGAKYPDQFEYAVIENGRNYVNLSLPYGDIRAGYNILDTSLRAVTFSQASIGAQSFDGDVTTLTVGYHGKNAFTSCLVSGTEICSCSWPLNNIPKNCELMNDAVDIVAVNAQVASAGNVIGVRALLLATIALSWW